MIPKPPSCQGCPLYAMKKDGFSLPDGDGSNGVMIVAEALGEHEEREGRALVGPSGLNLFRELLKVGIIRDGFTLFNCVACRPPDNKLLKMWYEKPAVEHCAPNLDKAIETAREAAKRAGKTFVIVTLGKIAFKRVMGYDDIRHRHLLKLDYGCYPFWNEKYQAWVLSADHPAYLLRGSTHLWPVVQFVFTRALEIAANGLVLDAPDYLLDPAAFVFDHWAGGYYQSLEWNPNNPLSYDIETPYKAKVTDEDDIEKAENADHTIIRISFSYMGQDGLTHSVSVRWSTEFMATIEALFLRAPFTLGWNSYAYDHPRVGRYLKLAGVPIDGMIAWHILNARLPKALGFVTPFYCQNTTMWKHLSDEAPAYYNCKDSEKALINFLGIERDLKAAGMWHIYERHWMELSKALQFMSDTGVRQDMEMRDAADVKMAALLADINAQIESSVPYDARALKILKKEPKHKDDYTPITKEFPVEYCGQCGLQAPKRWKKHAALCGSAERTALMEPFTCWARPEPFKISQKSLLRYQTVKGHKPIKDPKTKKIVFNKDAIVKLRRNYQGDPLYGSILDHRKVEKLHSTYVGVRQPNGRILGGMPIAKDGRVHTIFGRDANTLRFTSREPNLQNLPRPAGPDDLASIIRNLFIADPGKMFYARDFSGIEAVLTGYFAMDERYIHLAKKDVHTYYTVYSIYEQEGPVRIQASELPDLSWPDEKLFPYLEHLKGRFKNERNKLYKHLVHANNFMQSARGQRDKIFHETGIEYPVPMIQKVQDVYFALFPKIHTWHSQILDECEGEGYLRNPFGYTCRFSRPYEYKWQAGQKTKRPGEDANKAIAFKPQSTAAGIITEVILRLFYNRFEEAGQFMRLQIHDEIFFEVPRTQWEALDLIVKEEMERPIPELPVPESWGIGPYLNILSEAKADFNEPSRWGSMRGV